MRECTEKAQSYTDNELNIVLHYNLQWFAADGEGGEKTEPATDKKLRDARDEGKVAKSKELTAAFDLIVLFLVLKVFMSFVGEKLLGFFSYIYNRMPDFLNETQKDMSSVTVRNFMNDIILQFLLTCLPFLYLELLLLYL